VGEGEKVVERFADALFGLDEFIHPSLERLDGRTRCNVVKEVAPDDSLGIFVSEARFVLIVGDDRSDVIDDDGAEGELIQTIVGDVDDTP